MNEKKGRESLAGKRVTVMGLGRFGGGIGVSRWLCESGAVVTVSDRASEAELQDSVQQINDCDVVLHLGGHREEDFVNSDLIVVNPAVAMDHPVLATARHVPKTTEINLFLERCPAPVIGVTGSAGKSTTVAMVGAILSEKFTTHVGGNIGRCLLGELDNIQEDHLVVLELSSFQIENLPLVEISPRVSLVTNIVENHLDRHGTMNAYVAAKQNIYRYQKPDDILLLNGDDPVLSTWSSHAPGIVEFFSTPCGERLDPADYFELSVPGLHNQANAQAAWAIAKQFGIERQTAASVLCRYSALPHRLQEVCRRDGICYINDSKSTAPGETIVAIRALEGESVILLAGGHDKGVSFDRLAQIATRNTRAIVTFGAAGRLIRRAIDSCSLDDSDTACHSADTLAEAFVIAENIARSGDTILLSPGCASFDEFDNYRHRGEVFMKLSERSSQDTDQI